MGVRRIRYRLHLGRSVACVGRWRRRTDDISDRLLRNSDRVLRGLPQEADRRRKKSQKPSAGTGDLSIALRTKKAPLLQKEAWPNSSRSGWSISREDGLPTYRSIYHPVSRSGCHPSFRRRGAFFYSGTLLIGRRFAKSNLSPVFSQ